ncbi:MAG: hypothetical protein M1820_007205 [Bogoriella megaspora]|nr:MAG: hypothetical protein M1820_007205 [Bogoriella megaspora]
MNTLSIDTTQPLVSPVPSHGNPLKKGHGEHLTPRLSLRNAGHKSGLFELVVDDDLAREEHSSRIVDVAGINNEWVGVDLTNVSSRLLDSWVRPPAESKRRENRGTPTSAPDVKAFAKPSKGGFILRLRRKLNRTRDAVADVHLLPDRLTKDKTARSRGENKEEKRTGEGRRQDQSQIFPRQPELDGQDVKELGAQPPTYELSYDAIPRAELPTRSQPSQAPSLDSTVSPRAWGSERSLTMFSTSTLVADDGESRQTQTTNSATQSPLSNRRSTLESIEDSTHTSTDTGGDQFQSHLDSHVSNSLESSSVLGHSTVQSERLLSSPHAKRENYLLPSDTALPESSHAAGQHSRTEVTLHDGQELESSEEQEKGKQKDGVGIQTTVARELSISKTRRYETNTDEDPESPVSGNESPTLPHSPARRDFSAPPSKPASDRSTSTSPDDSPVTESRRLSNGLDSDARVEELWATLLKAQAYLLSQEHPSVFEARHQLALSRLIKHRDVKLITALEKTEEEVIHTLGQVHPHVRAYVADLSMLRKWISRGPGEDVEDSRHCEPASPAPAVSSSRGVNTDIAGNTNQPVSTTSLPFSNCGPGVAMSEPAQLENLGSRPQRDQDQAYAGANDASNLSESESANNQSDQNVGPSNFAGGNMASERDAGGAAPPPRVGRNGPKNRVSFAEAEINRRQPPTESIPVTEALDEGQLAIANSKAEITKINTNISAFELDAGPPVTPLRAAITPGAGPHRVESWLHTQRTPPQDRNSGTHALKMTLVALSKAAIDTIFWLQGCIGMEPPLLPGLVRVRWTCACGAKLYDDFTELRRGAANELEAYLNRPREHPSNHPPSAVSSPATSRVFTGSSYSQVVPSSATSWSAQTPGSNSFSSQRNLYRPSSAHLPGSRLFGPPSSSRPEPPWLLTCASEEKLTPKVSHLDVASETIHSDKDLANSLRKLYYDVNRKWYRAFRLRGLTSIEFVGFEMHQNRFTDINASPDMPPPNTGYDFVAVGLMPPVGSQYFRHLFMHPEEYDGEDLAYCRVPKKMGRLQFGQGWGINLVEDFLSHRVWALVTISSVLFSLVFAVTWACWTRDIQGAFGIACYIMAVAGMVMAWIQSLIG